MPMAYSAVREDTRMAVIPLERISPSPYQPRRVFDAEALRQLAESIAQHGLIQPITVRRLPGGSYQLVAGERRLRACAMAGIRHVRAHVLNISDLEAAMITVSENLQREDLNCFEEAQGYKTLLDMNDMTQQQLARQLGISQSAVANKLRLLRLDDAVRHAVVEGGLSERHARALLRVHNPAEQERLARHAAGRQLSVRQLEGLIERQMTRREEDVAAAPTSLNISRSWRDWRLFANSMKSAVGELKQAGLSAHFELEEDSAHVLMRIIVPKRR